MSAAEKRPPEFLAAWREAVELIGPALFKIKFESVDTAMSKDALRPDFDAFTAAIGSMSSGQQIFAIAVYQFFSDTDALSLCEQCGLRHISMPEIANLSDHYRNIIIRLLNSYIGW